MSDKTLSPSQVRTERHLLSLRRDNKTAGDFWMLVGEDQVTLCHQAVGNPPVGDVTIPRAEFNRLLRWYLKPQKVAAPTAQGVGE